VQGLRPALLASCLCACAHPPPPPSTSPAPSTSPSTSTAPSSSPSPSPSPFETAASIFLVDPGTPAWLRDRVTADIARSFEFYTAKLGPLSPPKATVHLSFGTREHGRSIGGEAHAANVVVMRVELEADAASGQDAAVRLAVDEFVAHEAAHLWTDPHTSRSKSLLWMHEGLPDAFALREVRAIGAMSDAQYRAAVSNAASECAMWLSNPRTNLSDLPPGQARAAYVCGATVALAVEAGFASARPGGDLLSYWLAVLARPVAPVASHAFFAPLTLIPERRDAAAAADVVVASSEPRLDAMLRRALTEAGLQLVDRPSGPFPEDYEQHASVPAVSALLTPGCVAALAFDGDSEVLPRVALDDACPGLAKGDRLESLTGVPLGPKGAMAWDAGYASCQSRHAVDIGVRGTTVTVPCDPAARPRPAYFDVQGVP
jgi:hypothetical protein